MTENTASVVLERDSGKLVWTGTWGSRDAAKSLGAEWDAHRRVWLIPFTPMYCRRLVELSPKFPGLRLELPEIVRREADAELQRADALTIDGANGDLCEILYGLSLMRPMDHQVRGSVAIHLGNTFLSWEMGTGKTKATVDAMQLYSVVNEKPIRAIVACPLAVIPGWGREVKRQWNVKRAGGVEVLLLSKGSVAQKAKRIAEAVRLADARGWSLIVVINYESMIRSPLAPKSLHMHPSLLTPESRGGLLSVAWDFVVADESHNIKNHDSKATMMLHRLGEIAMRRVALTGTPMPNNPLDIWAQAKFVDSGYFGANFFAFRTAYADIVKQEVPIRGGRGKRRMIQKVVGFKDLDLMSDVMRRFVHRVSKDEVLELPPLRVIDVPVTLTEKTQLVHDQVAEGICVELESGEISPANALAKLTRLQQISSGIGGYQVETDRGPRAAYERIGTEKLEAAKAIIDGLSPHEPVVVFSKWTPDVEGVQTIVEGRPIFYLRGGTNELEAWKESCRNGYGAVLSVQIASGGTGVEMVEATHAIYLSVGYEWGDYEQSTSRLHRKGQDRPVNLYRLIAENTIDEIVYAALGNKESNAMKVLTRLRESRKDAA